MKRLLIIIEGKKLRFEVPQTWEELDIKTACRVIEALQKGGDDNYYILLSALLDLTLESVMDIQADSMKENVLQYLTWISDEKGWKELVTPKCPQSVIIEETVFPIQKDISKGTFGQMEQAKQLLESELTLHEKCIEILNIYVNNRLINEDDFRATMEVLPAMQVLPIAYFFLKKASDIYKPSMILSQIQEEAMSLHS